jgi:hypothetical protein
MREKSLFYCTKKWIKHPTYFVFFFALGLCAWSFTFQAKKPKAEIVQFSLHNYAQNEFYLNEAKFISRFPSSEITNPKKQLPKRFRSNPAFKLFDKLKKDFK